MTTEKSIETLVSEAKLTEAQARFNTFLEFCEDKKNDLLQSQSRISFLQDKANAGTLTREDDIERNKITLSFINDISTFRRTLSSYFNVGDSREFFNNIKNRDDVVQTALEPKVTDRQYLIDRQLKDGNSSIVFKLKKAHTGQDAIALVLKMPELTPETQAEYIKIMGLRHRNIIKLLDHELTTFPFFLITEFVHGESLAKAIAKTGARPLAQMLDWLYQLTDALDYMRHKGVLHTNVRPSKVFVDEELNVMISPFGFNKKNLDDRTFFKYQDVCLYGSPELVLADGEPLTLSEMCISDQYSLGLMGYKILTGKDLFEGDSIVEILKNREKFSTSKQHRAAKLATFPSGTLRAIFTRLLTEEPQKRFANLHEVMKSLHPHTRKTHHDAPSDLRASYRRCLAKNRSLITDFYALVFEKLPEIKADFQNPQRQLAMLQMSVDILIDIDDKQDLLIALMSNERHKSYGIEKFDVFVDTLLTIIEDNDPKWETVAADWQMLRAKTLATIVLARNPVD
jgi:serine/threonine protein kinase